MAAGGAPELSCMFVVNTGFVFKVTLIVSPRSRASRIGETSFQVTPPSVVLPPMVVLQAGGVTPEVPLAVTCCKLPLESTISAPTGKAWLELHDANKEPEPVGMSFQVTPPSPGVVVPTTVGHAGAAAPDVPATVTTSTFPFESTIRLPTENA